MLTQKKTRKSNSDTWKDNHEKIGGILKRFGRSNLERVFKESGLASRQIVKEHIEGRKPPKKPKPSFMGKGQVIKEGREYWWVTYLERFRAWLKLSEDLLSNVEQDPSKLEDFSEKVFIFAPHIRNGNITYSGAWVLKEELDKNAQEVWDKMENEPLLSINKWTRTDAATAESIKDFKKFLKEYNKDRKGVAN